MRVHIFVSLFAVFILGGCSSGISKTDCLQMDWEQVGFVDGERGLDIGQLGAHQDTCSEHEVSADADAYYRGHEQGVREFCQPENGFEMGKQGYRYTGICPEDLENDFYAEYDIGLKFQTIYYEINQIERTLNNNSATITKLHSGINLANLRLDTEDLTFQQQTQLRQSIESMTDQVLDYELDSQRLEPALTQKLRELEALNKAYGR